MGWGGWGCFFFFEGGGVDGDVRNVFLLRAFCRVCVRVCVCVSVCAHGTHTHGYTVPDRSSGGGTAFHCRLIALSFHVFHSMSMYTVADRSSGMFFPVNIFLLHVVSGFYLFQCTGYQTDPEELQRNFEKHMAKRMQEQQLYESLPYEERTKVVT